MPEHHQKFVRLPLVSTVRSCLLGLGVAIVAIQPGVVLAQTTEVTANQDYALPAGPLAASLNLFAIQAGITLSFDPVLVEGRQAPALQGSFSVATGLEYLLKSSGLTAVPGVNGGYRLQQNDSAELAVHQAATLVINGYVSSHTKTGTKIDVPIREIPQSVSVVTEEQAKIQSAQSLDQVLQYSAGVVSVTGGATKNTDQVFSLRGFDDRTNSTLYINGSKLTRNIYSGTTEPYGFERFEVLKGPASALYGRAAPGGIINLVSKKPTAEPIQEIQIQTGSNDRAQFAGDFAGALNTDESLTYRVTGLYRDANTDIDYIPDDRTYLAPSLRWQISEDTTLTLRAEFKKDETAYSYGLPFEGSVIANPNGSIAPERFIGEPDYDRWDSENSAFSYQFEHRINDNVQLRQNLHSFNSEVEYRYASWGMFIPGMGSFIWADPQQTTVHRGFADRRDDDDGYSVDTSLTFDFDTGSMSHQLLLGYDYVDGEFKRQQTRGILGLNPFGSENTLNLYNPVYETTSIDPMLSFRSVEGSALKQKGIYLHDHVNWGDNWVVSAGIRRDDVSLQSNYSEPDSGYTEAFTEDSDATTYNFGVVYLFDNGLSPYISYSESFQPNIGLDDNGELFNPSTGEQFEIGVKYRPEGSNMEASVALFDIEQNDLIVNSLAGYSSGYQVDIESKGLELEAHAHLTDNLNLIAAYTYVDAEVTKSTLQASGFARYKVGNRTAAQPEHAFSLWADYRLNQLPGLTVAGGVRYLSETTDFSNRYTVPSYTLLDAAVLYDIRNWRLALNVKNLTNKEYIAACTYACWYGDSRTVVGTATYRW